MRPIPTRNHDHTEEESEQIARNCKESRWAQRLRAVAMVVRGAQRCEAAEAHGVAAGCDLLADVFQGRVGG